MNDEDVSQTPDAMTEPLPTKPVATEPLVTVPLASEPPMTETAAQASDARAPSFVRRHSFASALVGAALAVVLVSGGTAWAVAASVSANQVRVAAVSGAGPAAGSAAGGATTARGGTGAKDRANAKRKAARILARGTIVSIAPSSWSIKTPAGATVTVTITSTTKYGRPKAPATAASFAVGDSIVVLGHRTGDTMTARRIVAPAAHSGTTGSNSTSVDPTTS